MSDLSFDENNLDATPPDIVIETQNACDSLLPSKSELKYMTTLHNFLQWKSNKNASSFSEQVFFFESVLKNVVYTWTFVTAELGSIFGADEILPVGSIRVNTLNELCLSPALKDLLDFSLTRPNSGPRPLLNTKSKVFELDSCRTIGKICLVHTGGMWSVWLVTREGAWGWLADSFTHYFRMALVHLGLPGWQAAFANLPLIPWAEQLFLLLAPHLLEKTESESNSLVTTASETGLNHIDPNIFKNSVRHHKSNTRQTNQ